MNDYKANISLNVIAGDASQNYQQVIFNGEMDKAGLTAIREQLETLVGNFTKQYLVLDFNRLDFINSEGIGFLITLHTRLVKSKKSLVVINANSHVKDVLNVVGILNVIGYYDNLEVFKQKTAL